MVQRYRLTERAFLGGEIKERDAIVTLLPHEKPGAHMVPVPDMADVQPVPVLVSPPSYLVAKAPSKVPEARSEAPKAPSSAPIAAHTPLVLDGHPDRDFLAGQSTSSRQLVDKDSRARRGPGYLVVDTETNGFADPRAAVIAILFVNDSLEIEHEHVRLIRPDGWQMDARAQAVNGLAMDRLEAEGVPIAHVLPVYLLGLAWGRTLVAHNLEFDRRVLDGEVVRAAAGIPATGNAVCTMLAARRLCGVGGLGEAHEKLCGGPVEGAHDALNDARACLNIFRVLKREGALQ